MPRDKNAPRKDRSWKSFFYSKTRSPQPVTPVAGRSQDGSPNPHTPATSPAQVQKTTSSSTQLKAVTLQNASISELWNVAYEELQAKEPKLMADYEESLSYSVSSIIPTTTMISGLGKIKRQEQMELLVKQKLKEDEEGQWRVPFGDDRIAIRDLVEPVVNVIGWAQEYVGDALEASPYGSLAWGGVCLLLPVGSARYFCSFYLLANLYPSYIMMFTLISCRHIS